MMLMLTLMMSRREESNCQPPYGICNNKWEDPSLSGLRASHDIWKSYETMNTSTHYNQ